MGDRNKKSIMKKFIYKNKKTGQVVESDKSIKELENSDKWQLVREVKSGQMPDNKIRKK